MKGPDGVDRVTVADMTLVAWVGPDEFDGSRGLKGGFTEVGFTPLVAKGEHEHKMRRPEFRAAMQALADEYKTRIQLVRFHYVEVIETVEPRQT